MLKITSKENARIKELSKLYASRRERRESGLFVLEGVRLVCDALENGIPVREIYATDDGLCRLGDRFPAFEKAAEAVFWIDEPLASRIGDTERPQGVFAVCEGALSREGLPEDLSRGCLVLCSLQDPGNVGTILRSAAAFGLPAVMTSDCPEPASPKVLRAAMGVRKAWVTDDIFSTLSSLKARGCRVYAAALGDASVPIDRVSLRGAAVVIGNEGAGLPESVLAACDERVILPLSKDCESLNAAMAATIFAWELSCAAREETR